MKKIRLPRVYLVSLSSFRHLRRQPDDRLPTDEISGRTTGRVLDGWVHERATSMLTFTYSGIPL